MKILMVVSSLLIGGTETFVIALAKALRAKGVQVGIATTGGPLLSVAKRSGITIHTIPTITRFPQRAAADLDQIIRIHQYTIIQPHDTPSITAVNLLKLNSNRPIVVPVLGSYYNQTVLRSTAQKAKKIIAASPNIYNWLLKLPINRWKIQTIPAGIDTSYFKPASQPSQWRNLLKLNRNVQVVGYAGRFSADKHTVARKVILAVERIARKNPNLVAVLVGRGVYFASIKGLAEQVNQRLKRTVILVRPATTDVRWLYWLADVYVGTGRTALEAMSSGKPVIGAGSSGYSRIVTPSTLTSSINCTFGDHLAKIPVTIANLERDIGLLLPKPALRRSLGSFGRTQVIRRFSIESVAHSYLQIYKKL